MNWYYAVGTQRFGPVAETELAELVKTGTVRADTLVRPEAAREWQPYGSLSPTGETFHCRECGRAYPAGELLPFQRAYVCFACKNAFFQKLQEGALLLSPVRRYAGFGMRLLARLIDGLILGLVNVCFYGVLIALLFQDASSRVMPYPRVLLLTGLFYLTALITSAGYEAWFLVRYGATPGKLALRLRVVDTQERPLRWGRALARYFALGVSYMTFFGGFLMAAFDPQRRALHDHLCATRVLAPE